MTSFSYQSFLLPTDSQVPNSAADIYQQGPDNICSHAARLTTVMYFNQMLPDDGDHTETC